MRVHATHLVGPRDAYVRHCHNHGVPVDSAHVVHVSTLEELKNVHDGNVVFLRGWELLKDGRAMYGYVIAERSSARLEAEYADLVPDEVVEGALRAPQEPGGA